MLPKSLGSGVVSSVMAYTIGAGGALTFVGSYYPGPITGCPTTCPNPYFDAVNAMGKYVYVTNSGTNSVAGFRIGAGGALVAVPGTPFAAGSVPIGIATCRVANGGPCIPPPL